MCGIVAKLHLTNLERPRDIERQMTDALIKLQHRGPDFQDQWVDCDKRVALGHTRLSIQDLSNASNQPFQRNNLVLSFNGEIYNFKELRHELSSLGHHFKTSGDTEVITAAFEQWGRDCFKKFNGMWAIALWDAERHTLTVSRDRFGVKPLFYYASANEFICASELTSFPAFEEIGIELDIDYFALASQLGSVAECLVGSLLKDVRKFPPGCSMEINALTGECKLHRWWQPGACSIEVPGVYQQRKEKFIELLQDATDIRARSDAKMAIALSGGMDSGSVAMLLQEEFSAYTCDFLHGPSEAEDAKKIMGVTDKPHHIVPCSTPSLAEMLECTIQIGDVCNDSFIGLDKVYRQMSEDGVKVSIEGHGGDEILAGYTHHLLCGLMDSLAQSPNEEITVLNNFGKAFSQNSGQIQLDAMILSSRPIKDRQEFLSGQLSQITEQHKVLDCNNTSIGDSYLQTRLQLDFYYNTLPSILRNFDRLSMRHGIEVRSPFLDFRVVSYCAQLPMEDLLNHGYSKWILRDSMAALPDDIRYNKVKMGFVSPFVLWCENVPANQWREFLVIMEELGKHFQLEHLKKQVIWCVENRQFGKFKTIWGQVCVFFLMAKLKGIVGEIELY